MELTIADVLRSLSRYRPVAVTVAAILVALAVLPKPDAPEELTSTELGGIATPSATAPAASTPPPAAEGFGTEGVDTFASDGVSFTPNPSFGAGSSSGFSSGSSGSGSAESSSSPSSDSSFGSGASFTRTVPDDEDEEPLRVTAKAWASRTAGTPLAAQGVPAGTLPVGVRGTNDKLSFVRLSGGDTTLGLVEDPAGTRNTHGPAGVQACQITDQNWPEREAAPLAEAPKYDANKCIPGTRSASGVWLFDLSSFGDPTDARGFALVPGGAGLDFQVAFRIG